MSRPFSNRKSGLFLGFVLCGVAAASAAESQTNEALIREVIAGRSKVARAAWWGFNAQESTQALQSAIKSGAEQVIVEKMPGPWIVDKIELAGNQEIVFEPGVVVQAKKGAFRGTADSLMTAWNKANIKLTGKGATLRMHRADYDSPDYKKAEWRHVLSFRGCDQVIVTGLTLAESGGDGIYLGTGRRGEPNRNITIRDVVCDRNYRQGISVISAENLLIENCTLKDTAGTAPAAGIDFEPNHPSERLVNCVMRNCTIENNQGYAIHIYARPLDGTSEPVTMRIEDCTTRGTNALSASVITSCGETGPLKGQIEFVNCRFEDQGRTALHIGSKPPSGVKLRFVGCTLADPSEKPAPTAPIRFSSRQGDLEPTGGVEFKDCTIREKVQRPLMKYDDALGSNLLGISGTLTVERDGQRTAYTLDQELIRQWVPFDSLLTVRPVALEGLRLEPAGAVAPPAERKVPPHRIRGEACYLLHASAGDAVRLRLTHQAVGQSEGKLLAVRVLDPAGKEVQQVSVELGQQADCTFTAGQTGVFTLLARPDRHMMAIVSSTHPIAIAGNGGSIHLIRTTGDLYFWVPAEAGEFGVRIKGEGDAERVSAAIRDASGATRWEQSAISDPQSLHVRREPAASGEVWRLSLARPSEGILEDTYFEIRGIPAILGFDPKELLRPASGEH